MLGTPAILCSGDGVCDPLLYWNTGSEEEVQKAIIFAKEVCVTVVRHPGHLIMGIVRAEDVNIHLT